MRTYIALAAIGILSTNRIDESDIVQISTSSRATLSNTCFAGACARVGALVYLAGLVEPLRTLQLLALVPPARRKRTNSEITAQSRPAASSGTRS